MKKPDSGIIKVFKNNNENDTQRINYKKSIDSMEDLSHLKFFAANSKEVVEKKVESYPQIEY